MNIVSKLIAYTLIVPIAFCGCGSKAENTESTSAIAECVEPTTIIVEPVVEATAPDAEPSVEDIKELEYFCKDICYDYAYIDSGELIPHGLFIPSTAGEYEKIPLILWLHGADIKNSEAVKVQTSGIAEVITSSDFVHMEGINAYILAPHLVVGDFWSPSWITEESRVNVKNLLDYYIENCNVDPNKIVIAGHSLGAQGALYMAQVLPEYFCAMAPLSSYNPCIPLTNTEIPIWCFVGVSSCGEDRNSVSYTWSDFKHVYGEDCITSLPVSHANLPFEVFSMDDDLNNRTDLFEWFVAQMES